MIHINLLPVRQIRQRLKVRDEVAIYSASLFFLLIGLFFINLNLTYDIKNLKGENLTLTTKKASYQPILNEIEKLKKDKQTQEVKLEVIKTLKTGSQITVHAMDELAKIIPSNRLWLKSFTQSANNLNIAGVALDNATIAQLMTSILESGYFSGAELTSSSQTVIAGAKLKSFSLKIGLTSPK